jgi:hypothetical protein
MDYMANCNGPCETVDKTTLNWFKIDAVGLLNPAVSTGYWGTDVLINNNNSWVVEIPPTLKKGNYVLRHEIIALHAAGSANGAQNYVQCVNLAVSGTGTAVPAGVKATTFYTATDPGILFNHHTCGRLCHPRTCGLVRGCCVADSNYHARPDCER